MTFPRLASDLLMLPPSFSRRPSAPVALTLSLGGLIIKDESENVTSEYKIKDNYLL